LTRWQAFLKAFSHSPFSAFALVVHRHLAFSRLKRPCPYADDPAEHGRRVAPVFCMMSRFSAVSASSCFCDRTVAPTPKPAMAGVHWSMRDVHLQRSAGELTARGAR